MNSWLMRTSALIGDDNINRLNQTTVAVVGLGGVGGACAEALCRAGVGNIIIVDHDTVDVTNINRQLFATFKTVGEKKALAAKNRLLDINPNCNIIMLDLYYNCETKDDFFSHKPDYVIDAIDTVTSKLDLISECFNRNIPIISSMGTGNRLDPTKFNIGTIEQTAGCGCGLAKVMRRELKKRNVSNLTVLYSSEIPQTVIIGNGENGRHSPASISFCPPVAGYIIASHIINSIITLEKDNTTK